MGNIQNKINDYSDSIFKYIENIEGELIELRNSFNNIVDKINDANLKSVKSSEFFNSVSLDDFKENFDKMLLRRNLLLLAGLNYLPLKMKFVKYVT